MTCLNWPLTVAVLCLFGTLSQGNLAIAQTTSPVVRYHFSLESGPTVSVYQKGIYRDDFGHQIIQEDNGVAGSIFVGIEMVNGVSILDKVKIGLGTGFQATTAKMAKLAGLLPFFVDLKYIPLPGKISPIIIQRGGGVYWAGSGAINPVGGFYSGFVGVYIRSPKRIAGSVTLGYQMSHYATSGYAFDPTGGAFNARGNHFMSSVSLRGGINF